MTYLAAIQMVSSPSVKHNLKRAQELITIAVEKGAKLIVLPENFAHMGENGAEKFKIAEIPGEGPIQDFLKNLSQKYQIYLVGGSIPLKINTNQLALNNTKIHSSSLIYDPEGKCIGGYHKIHLFDVQISEQEFYSESKVFEPGKEIVVVNTALGNIGLSICYDLRFPEMYRKMLGKNVEIIVVPSAFTYLTGKAHWEILLRARAIENLSYVIAPNQGGTHEAGRRTYGHSMIINHWGEILSQHAEGEAVVIAEFNKKELIERRKTFPALQHRQMY